MMPGWSVLLAGVSAGNDMRMMSTREVNGKMKEEPKRRGSFQDQPAVTRFSILCVLETCAKQDPAYSGDRGKQMLKQKISLASSYNLLGTHKHYTYLFFCVWRRANSNSFQTPHHSL